MLFLFIFVPGKMQTRASKDTPKVGRTSPPPPNLTAPPTASANAAEETSHTAMTANSALDARMLQMMMNSLKEELFAKMDGVAAKLHSEIISANDELKASIEPLQRLVDSHEMTIRDLELSANDHSSRITELEAKVSKLDAEVTRLHGQCEDLESRSRRNNIRLVGIPEDSEGPKVTDFTARMLQEVLGLNEKPLLDRAHRTLREKPRAGAPPRPILARVHFFHVRNLILQRAGEASPLLYKGKRISIFPDFTSAVAKRRAAFEPVKRSLRSIPGVKYGLFYPANLKITSPDGTSRQFDDPSSAFDYIEKNLK